MNAYFRDAQHHVEQATKNARDGIEKEVDELETRARKLVGKEKEPEPSRLEKFQQDLANAEKKAEGEARDALESARQRIADYRKSD